MKTVILTQGDLDYELGVGLGNWAKSKEDNHLEIGHTRVIGGILMAVYMRKLKMFKSEYTWTPVDRDFNSFENQREWRNSL